MFHFDDEDEMDRREKLLFWCCLSTAVRSLELSSKHFKCYDMLNFAVLLDNYTEQVTEVPFRLPPTAGEYHI